MKNAIVTMSSTFWAKRWKRKEENCIFLYTLIYFLSFSDTEVQLTLKWQQGTDNVRGRRSKEGKGIRARVLDAREPFPPTQNSLSFSFPTLEAEEKYCKRLGTLSARFSAQEISTCQPRICKVTSKLYLGEVRSTDKRRKCERFHFIVYLY